MSDLLKNLDALIAESCINNGRYPEILLMHPKTWKNIENSIHQLMSISMCKNRPAQGITFNIIYKGIDVYRSTDVDEESIIVK